MKTNKFFAFCLAAFAFAGSQSVAFGQGSEAGAAQDRPPDPLAVYRRVGINTEQEEQIKKLAKDFEDVQRVKAKTLVALLRSLDGLSLQADPPEDQVISTQEEINKITGEMATDRMRLLLKVRKVLSPDQRKKLVTLMAESRRPRDQTAGQGPDGPDTGN